MVSWQNEVDTHCMHTCILTLANIHTHLPAYTNTDTHMHTHTYSDTHTHTVFRCLRHLQHCGSAGTNMYTPCTSCSKYPLLLLLNLRGVGGGFDSSLSIHQCVLCVHLPMTVFVHCWELLYLNFVQPSLVMLYWCIIMSQCVTRKV